jgi:hypothetical protein
MSQKTQSKIRGKNWTRLGLFQGVSEVLVKGAARSAIDLRRRSRVRHRIESRIFNIRSLYTALFYTSATQIWGSNGWSQRLERVNRSVQSLIRA